MARYTKEQMDNHLAQVRRLLVINPDLSCREIREHLMSRKDNPIKLTPDYIRKMKNEVIDSRNKRYDSYTVDNVLAKFQDELEEMKKILWSIIMNQLSTPAERVRALRELRNNSDNFFERMFNAGIFEKKLGIMDINEQKTLKDIESLPQDEQREIFKKLAEAEKLIKDKRTSQENKD